MRNRTLAATIVVASVALFSFAQPAQSEAEFVMNFATVAPDNTPWSKQLRGVEKRIEEESGGRIQVKLFLGGSLGSEIECIQDVARGERIQGGGFSTGAMGEAMDIPILTLIELPYLFSTNTQADAVLDQVLYEPTKAALSEKGFVLGGWAENGWRNFATTGPASNKTDLAKFKMRAQENPVHMDMYKMLGVQAVAKPVSEVLPSLNTGIVDGFDNTASPTTRCRGISTNRRLWSTQRSLSTVCLPICKKWSSVTPLLNQCVAGLPFALSRESFSTPFEAWANKSSN
jgi:TRAP-type C4-dicarboxylate transport system substrate-binding protein